MKRRNKRYDKRRQNRQQIANKSPTNRQQSRSQVGAPLSSRFLYKIVKKRDVLSNKINIVFM